MPAFYVPARDSRHRVACFALYRALLRQVPRVTLPDDLTTPARPGWTNPILYLIRSGFRRNKNDTSPRLVTSALRSGYRFLTLLTRAHDASSPQHSEIVSFLRERQAKFPPAPPPPPPPPPPPAEREQRARFVPMFTKVSPPHDLAHPVYAPTKRPVPLAALRGGRRRVPHVELASVFPFLRVGKPQSHVLANVLRRKIERRQARITHLLALGDEALRAASREDEWEEILARQARREGVELAGIREEEVEAAASAEGGRVLGEEDEDEDLSEYASSLMEFKQQGDYVAAADVDDGGGGVDTIAGPPPTPQKNRKKKGVSNPVRNIGLYARTVRIHGVRHVKRQLNEEIKDVLARTHAMIAVVREEKRLAEEEKAQKKERRRKAWEEWMTAKLAEVRD